MGKSAKKIKREQKKEAKQSKLAQMPRKLTD